MRCDFADVQWLGWLRKFYVAEICREVRDVPVAYVPHVLADVRRKMVEAGFGEAFIEEIETALRHELDLSPARCWWPPEFG
jgi:hypothetical protein